MIEISISACPLFKSIEEEEIENLIRCLGAERHRFEKAEFVYRVGDTASSVGVVVSGSVNAIQEDYWGNRTILAHSDAGDLFGEAYSCAEEQRFPISVVAAEDSEVLLFDYRRIITTCTTACAFHTRLISNMLHIIANNSIRLTEKLDHVSKKSLREKLLSYLNSESMRSTTTTISIPFDRQELAEFLCADRSALSRELSNMRKDGLIDYEKNQFTLL